jgi:transposase
VLGYRLEPFWLREPNMTHARISTVLSGNTSDKKVNNAELTRIASYMKKHGLDPAAYIYVADSAMVTEDNLATFATTDDEGELKVQFFITRLPANYKAE